MSTFPPRTAASRRWQSLRRRDRGSKRASASPHRARSSSTATISTPPNRPGAIAPGSRFAASPSAIVSPTETRTMRPAATVAETARDWLDSTPVMWTPGATGPEREPGEEAPAADRCDDGELTGGLVVQFPADRGLAGDDERVVVGRYEGRLFGRPELEGVLLGDLVVVAVFDQLDREGPEGGDLGGRRVLRARRRSRPGRGAPRPTIRRDRDRRARGHRPTSRRNSGHGKGRPAPWTTRWAGGSRASGALGASGSRKAAPFPRHLHRLPGRFHVGDESG